MQFFKIKMNFNFKRGNMRRSYLHRIILGTLDYHYMKGFFGRLRKAKVMSKKVKIEYFYVVKRVIFDNQ